MEKSASAEIDKKDELVELKKRYMDFKKAIRPSDNVEIEIGSNTQKIDNINEQIGSTQQLIKEIRADQDWMKDEIERMENDIAQYDVLIEKYNQEIKDNQNSIRIMEKSNDKLKEKAKNNQQKEILQTKLKKLQNVIKDSNVNIQSLKVENANIRQRTNRFPDKIRKQRKIIKIAQEKKELLVKNISSIDEKMINLGKQNDELDAELNKGASEFKQLYNKHLDNEKEKKILTEKTNQLRNQIKNLQLALSRSSNENKKDMRITYTAML